jgi:hypothetical protein
MQRRLEFYLPSREQKLGLFNYFKPEGINIFLIGMVKYRQIEKKNRVGADQKFQSVLRSKS